jgi:HemY protein
MSLVGLLAAIAGGMLFGRDTGRVILTFGEWTVQTTVSFFVASVVILFILVYALIRAVLQLVHLPRDWSRWSSQRRRRRSEHFLLEGLVALLEGDWRAAEQALRRGAPFSRMPALNFLGAARSAQRQGALARRDHYLQLAHAESGGDSPEVELLRASLQLEGPDSEQAYAAIKGIEAQHPRDARVQLALLDAAIRVEDWDEARRQLGQVLVAKRVTEDDLLCRQRDVHQGLLRRAAASGRRDRLEAEWRLLPAKLQREPRLLAAYVDGRLRYPDTADCEPLLRRAIERDWDAELIRLYGLARGPDPARQLRRAESWLEGHARDPVLLLALGRLCRTGELWGKAREYLEESIRTGPLAEAFLELGALHEQRGDGNAAAESYRRGLELSARTGHQTDG